MRVKVRNKGNSFRTITSGELPTNGVTEIEQWEANVWLGDCTKSIEIIDEKPVEKPKRKKK